MSMIIASVSTAELLALEDARLILRHFQEAWANLGITAVCRDTEIPPVMGEDEALHYAVERAYPAKTKIQAATSQGRSGLVALNVEGASSSSLGNSWGLEAKGQILNGFVHDGAGGLIPMFDDPTLEDLHKAWFVQALYQRAKGKLRAHGQGRLWTNIMTRSGAMVINPSVWLLAGAPLVTACQEVQRACRALNLSTQLRMLPIQADEETTLFFLQDIVKGLRAKHEELEHRRKNAVRVKSVESNIMDERSRFMDHTSRLLQAVGKSVEDLRLLQDENEGEGIEAMLTAWGV